MPTVATMKCLATTTDGLWWIWLLTQADKLSRLNERREWMDALYFRALLDSETKTSQVTVSGFLVLSRKFAAIIDFPTTDCFGNFQVRYRFIDRWVLKPAMSEGMCILVTKFYSRCKLILNSVWNFRLKQASQILFMTLSKVIPFVFVLMCFI